MKREIWLKDTIALSRILLIVTFFILFSGIAHFLILSPARAQGMYCSNLQKVQVSLKPVVIVTQVTTSCSGDCQCLRESNAAANLGSSYEKCSENPCAYDSDGTAKYCFKSVVKVQPQISPVKVAPVAVPLTTTPVPMPVVRVIPVTTTPVPLVAPVAVPLTRTPVPMPDARVVTGTTTPVPLIPPSGVVQSVAPAKLFTSKEAFSALQIAVGKLPYSADLDINHDGKVDSSDVREILKIAVNSPGGVVPE